MEKENQIIDINEILAELFQKRPECDADGVFHYLLRERDTTLVVDTTPYREWRQTPEILKETLIIDCEHNNVSLGWIINGIYRASISAWSAEAILYKEDGDEDVEHRELVFVGLDIIVGIDLPPDQLSYRIVPRDYFYDNIYEEQVYRILSSEKPPQ